MYQFQEGFSSPMIELRSRSRGQKPQTLTVSLRSAPVTSGLGWQRGSGTADAPAQASRKHTMALGAGAWELETGPAAYELSPSAIDAVSQKERRGFPILPKQTPVSARLGSW